MRNILFLVLVIPIMMCCNNKKQRNTDSIADGISETSKHTPDTTINGLLKLEDYSPVNKFYESHLKFSYLEKIRESPIILFLNSDKKEYLMAYQYEGNTENTFSYFEIGYNDTSLIKLSSLTTNYKSFYTESGLSLGISLKELISIKGNNYIDVYNDNTLIRFENLADSSFLSRYNMPAYNLEIELKNNLVNKIKFGFEYP